MIPLRVLSTVQLIVATSSVLLSATVVSAEVRAGVRAGLGFRNVGGDFADHRRTLGTAFIFQSIRLSDDFSGTAVIEGRTGAGSFDHNIENVDSWTSFEILVDIAPGISIETHGAMSLRLTAAAGPCWGYERYRIEGDEFDTQTSGSAFGWVACPSAALRGETIEVSVTGKHRRLTGETRQTVTPSDFSEFDPQDRQKQVQSLRPEILYLAPNWHAGFGIEIERVRGRYKYFTGEWNEWLPWQEWEYAPYLTISFVI